MKHKPLTIRLLAFMSRLLVNDAIRTFVYLNLIYKPRKFLRLVTLGFYRLDHVYDVLKEFTRTYQGEFVVLEFGVAAGKGFKKKLYATQYLKVQHLVSVHGFDSFEGMPEASHKSDKSDVEGGGWVEGQFSTSYDKLELECKAKYRNYSLRKGYFEETLTEEFLQNLLEKPPILIWIDCDYYSSARTVFERLMNYIPNGCVIYFDEPEFNFGSRFSGEAKLIHEINHGVFGDDFELVIDANLSLSTKRIYRFVRNENPIKYKRVNQEFTASYDYYQSTNDSPFP